MTIPPTNLVGVFNLTAGSEFDPQIQFIQPFAVNAVQARLGGNPMVRFDVIAAGPDEIFRDAGDWRQDGFSVGQRITIEPTSRSASTNIGETFTISGISPDGSTLQVTESVTADVLRDRYVITGADRILFGTGKDLGRGDDATKHGFLYESLDGGATLRVQRASAILDVVVTEHTAVRPHPSQNVGIVKALLYGGWEAGTPRPDIAFVGTDGNSAGRTLFVRQTAGGAFNPILSFNLQGGGKVRDIAVCCAY